MARISFQVQPIPGEKKFKDFQENFETIMETLLYLQNAFPKIIEDMEDPEDRYGVDVIIAFDADHRHAGADTAKETTFQEPGAIHRKQKEKKEDRSRQITGTRGDI
jgi:hypothetical protein